MIVAYILNEARWLYPSLNEETTSISNRAWGNLHYPYFAHLIVFPTERRRQTSFGRTSILLYLSCYKCLHPYLRDFWKINQDNEKKRGFWAIGDVARVTEPTRTDRYTLCRIPVLAISKQTKIYHKTEKNKPFSQEDYFSLSNKRNTFQEKENSMKHLLFL